MNINQMIRKKLILDIRILYFGDEELKYNFQFISNSRTMSYRLNEPLIKMKSARMMRIVRGHDSQFTYEYE